MLSCNIHSTFAVVSSHWDADYYGNKTYYASPNPLFLDLSTGVSTIGLGFH
jgi:hypothetical protein